MRLSLFACFLVLCVVAAASDVRAQQSPVPQDSAQKSPSSRVAGQQTFESHCAGCHGLDGKGGERAHAIANSQAAGALDDLSLSKLIRAGRPYKGMPSFSSLSDAEVSAIVAYVRVLTGKGPGRQAPGNSVRGEQIFYGKAACGTCHAMRGKGGFMGPDLTDFAGTHSADELRLAVVQPDEWISPAHYVVVITTADQAQVRGLVRNEDNFSLQVQDPEGVFHFLLKSQISKVEREPHSLMPGDYGARLTPAELADLTSFLQTGLH